MITLFLLVQISAANADKLHETATAQDAKSAILCLAFTPNAGLLASGEVDQKIRIYDAGTGRQTALLEGHTKPVAALVFLKDGSTLYSTGYDRVVRIWDVATGRLKETQGGDLKKGIPGPLVDDLRATFSREAPLLAFGDLLQVWDLAAKKLLPHDSLSTHGWFDFDPSDGTLVSVGGTPKELGVIRTFERWDPRTNKTLGHWAGTPNASYERIAVSADGAMAAVIDVGGDDNKWKLELWDLKTKKRVSTPGFVENTVNGMAFTSDGSALATASLDHKLKLWDVKAGKELASYPHGRGFMGLALSADGSRLATADDQGGVQIWGIK
jgi:WD40 repeat protein